MKDWSDVTVGECFAWIGKRFIRLRCRMFGHKPAWDLGMRDCDPVLLMCLRCKRGLRSR